MKSTFSRLVAVALAVWLGLAAGAANAGTLTMTGFDGTASTGYNANFWNTGVSNPFSDWISFSIPSDSSGNGASNAISLGSKNTVIFTAFDLYESAILIASGITGGTSSYLSFTNGVAPGNYSLNVAGYKANPALSGSYAGNIAIDPVVAAVPEPETYAMMLAGLGLVGFSARRRNNNT